MNHGDLSEEVLRGVEEASEGRGVDEDNGGVGIKGRVVFSGKACAGGG